MMRTATFAVVLFAVGLMLGPAPAEAQTRPERDAYATLARAVSAAGTDPAPRRAADIRRAIERAYSVYRSHEQRRDAAQDSGRDRINNDAAEARSSIRVRIRHAELLGQSTAPFRAFDNLIPRIYDVSRGGWRYTPANGMESCERSYSECREIESAFRAVNAAIGRASGVHWRYLYAAADAMIEAASGLEGLAPRFIGFTMRHNASLQRLGSAKLAAIQNQGRVLRAASACESGRCSGGPTHDDFDGTLQGLVDAALAVAEGLASYREVAAEAEAPAPAPVAPAAEAPAAAEAGAPAPGPAAPFEEPEPEPVSLAEQWDRAVDEAVAEAERRVAELERATCGIFRGTSARIAISSARDRLYGQLPGARFVDVDTRGEAWQATWQHLDELSDRVEAHVRTLDPNCP